MFYNELDNRGTLNGNENTPLDLPVFAALPPFVTASAGTQDVIVPKNGTQSLSPGDYGLLQVERGAVLTLEGGIYNLRELLVKRSAQVQFAAAGEIRIEGRFTADRQTFLGPADEAGIDAADIIIYVKGINGASGTLDDVPKAAAVAQNSTLEANLYAPNGTLMLEMGSSASGSFIARDIIVEGNTEVSFNGAFFPGNPATLAKLNDEIALPKLAALPETYELQQNYPNPFNPSTNIRFALPQAAKVTLEIYNILGQKVRALISGSMEAGYHLIQWDGANDYGARVASGMYLYKLQADNFVEVKKMILMK